MSTTGGKAGGLEGVGKLRAAFLGCQPPSEEMVRAAQPVLTCSPLSSCAPQMPLLRAASSYSSSPCPGFTTPAELELTPALLGQNELS